LVKNDPLASPVLTDGKSGSLFGDYSFLDAGHDGYTLSIVSRNVSAGNDRQLLTAIAVGVTQSSDWMRIGIERRNRAADRGRGLVIRHDKR
jgi:hypothetical protein